MTQGILVLIAALGGAFVGAIVSGGLLILSHHLQAKRDDRRQQRAFERDVRSEPLERIRHAVEIGLRMVTLLATSNREGRITEPAMGMFPEFNLAFNGALLTTRAMGAQQLREELLALEPLMQDFERAISEGTFDGDLLSKVGDLLVRIESQYIELKVGN